MDPIEWLTVQDICRRLGLNLRTVYEFIDTGGLPAYRIAKVFHLQAAEVDAYIESRRIRLGELTHLVVSGNDGGGEDAT